MCGGAILAYLIPAPRSGQTWPAKNKRPRSNDDDEDFEAAFEEFDGDSEEEDEHDGMDAVDDDDDNEEELAKPNFPSAPPSSRRGKKRRAYATTRSPSPSAIREVTASPTSACASDNSPALATAFPAFVGEPGGAMSLPTANHALQPAPPAAASERTDDPEVFDPYDIHGGLASSFAGGAYESLESLFANGDYATVEADEQWPVGLWSFADDGSFCF
ncbi:hypothetical protein E2562_017747 [Oryza meyeriana var. granulata]|uniref:Uncharacterized protein n=1 Tax=Oryza meyeriana var. granulata TaxID=110450 RepID=A0A6G1BYQ2_9ORYZ|nr:hypothetical protein E2562_017747 [Oryza meyeriana var. granulata]